MDDFKKNAIKEIAENLNCGNNCYYNTRVDKMITIPNFLNITDEEEFKGVFQADLKKIEDQKADFIKFEVLKSFESFKIMEQFTDQLTEPNFKTELEIALRGRKPFKNFKYLIDNSDFRQNWFDFKQHKLENIVETQWNWEISSEQ